MRSIWIMAKKKLVPIAKTFAALFALRLELSSTLKLNLAPYRMVLPHMFVLMYDSCDESQ